MECTLKWRKKVPDCYGEPGCIHDGEETPGMIKSYGFSGSIEAYEMIKDSAWLTTTIVVHITSKEKIHISETLVDTGTIPDCGRDHECTYGDSEIIEFKVDGKNLLEEESD